jgi:hypothetical protein
MLCVRLPRGRGTGATLARVARSPSWEVTLLRRPAGGKRARVAGRVVVQAPDADRARRAAQEALLARSGGEPRWSLGVLRPLTPMAPGTHRYRVTFAVWEADGDGYERRDIHVHTVWAADATSARRLAQQEIQAVSGYRPAWRIRQVTRADRP